MKSNLNYCRAETTLDGEAALTPGKRRTRHRADVAIVGGGERRDSSWSKPRCLDSPLVRHLVLIDREPVGPDRQWRILDLRDSGWSAFGSVGVRSTGRARRGALPCKVARQPYSLAVPPAPSPFAISSGVVCLIKTRDSGPDQAPDIGPANPAPLSAQLLGPQEQQAGD